MANGVGGQGNGREHTAVTKTMVNDTQPDKEHSQIQQQRQHPPSVRLIAPDKQATAGFLAGLVSSLLTHPVDLLKTRYQSSKFSHYHSARKAIIEISRTEGWKALYNGWTPALVGSSLSWGAYFLLYSQMKNMFRYRTQLSNDDNNASQSSMKLHSYQHFIASLVSGVTVQLLTNPIWVLKTNCTLNSDGTLKGNMDQIWKSRGIMGFYKGLVPSMFGIVQSSLMMAIYERSKYFIQDRHDRYMNTPETLAITVGSKSISTVMTYPYQIFRTRLQHVRMNPDSTAKNITVKQIIQSVHSERGWMGFYRGMHVNLLRILPSTCITFLCFETFKVMV